MAFVQQNNSNSDQIAAAAYKKKAANIVFEVNATKQGSKFLDHLILLYGEPKIGKTTLFSKFPGVYFLPTEPGYRAVKVRKTPIPDWATFRQFVLWAEGHPNDIKDTKLWCIDTVTNLSKAAMQWVCGRDGISHPSDEEWGKGWEAFGDEFAFWVLRLVNLGKGVAFIAHSKTREIVSRRIKVTKEVPDLAKRTYGFINPLVDMILNMGFVERGRDEDALGEKRCIYTKPTEIRDAGDRTGKLPDCIEFKTEQEAVFKIMRAFNKAE
ncbi:MAG: ATP-binding protein [Phycisphaerae bacterium]|nr:ATP-binding protein [Phycisphaerae bacterium]